MAKTSYAVALGSNRRHGRHGDPRRVLRAAVAALAARGLAVERVSATHITRPLGSSARVFANAAAIVTGEMLPPQLLIELKRVERAFGRRLARRWAPRVLDLDILLWSEGCWEGPGLIIPHPAMRERGFVLEPLAEIGGDWRDPITGATIRQLLYRHRRATPVDPRRGRS